MHPFSFIWKDASFFFKNLLENSCYTIPAKAGIPFLFSLHQAICTKGYQRHAQAASEYPPPSTARDWCPHCIQNKITV
jgi:hypothetical protein